MLRSTYAIFARFIITQKCLTWKNYCKQHPNLWTEMHLRFYNPKTFLFYQATLWWNLFPEIHSARMKWIFSKEWSIIFSELEKVKHFDKQFLVQGSLLLGTVYCYSDITFGFLFIGSFVFVRTEWSSRKQNTPSYYRSRNMHLSDTHLISWSAWKWLNESIHCRHHKRCFFMSDISLNRSELHDFSLKSLDFNSPVTPYMWLIYRIDQM